MYVVEFFFNCCKLILGELIICDILEKFSNGKVEKEDGIKLKIEKIFVWKIEKKEFVVKNEDDESRDMVVLKVYKKEISINGKVINGYFFLKVVKKEEKVDEGSDEDLDDSFEKKVV